MSTPGINVPSTRPTRGERRREASRVHPTGVEPGPEEPAPTHDQTNTERGATEVETAATEKKVPSMTLPLKKKPAKRPFATQIRPSTAGRLEWIRRQGYALTDTVDDAINAYLDAAGVPQFDDSGNPIEPS